MKKNNNTTIKPLKGKSVTVPPSVPSAKGVGTTEEILTPTDSFKKELKTKHELYTALLEKHKVDALSFTYTVFSEVEKNPKLLEAWKVNPSSMFGAIVSAAEIGLIPNSYSGEFYLIPRNLKQPNGTYLMTVTGIIGYKGMVQILLRSGDIKKVYTEVVYEGDEFHVQYGLNPDIRHIPDFQAQRTADKIKYVYSVAVLKNGECQFAVMTRKEVEVVKSLATYDNGLYFNDKLGNNRWMERKAVLLQLAKLLPKDFYSTKAIVLESLAQSGNYIAAGENSDVKIIEATAVKKRDIYNTDYITDKPPFYITE